MTVDIRDARFYVVDEDENEGREKVESLEFDEAFKRAQILAGNGASIRVLYTDEASQTEITRFVSHGIPASPVSGG